VAHTERQLFDHRLQAFIDQGPPTVYISRPDRARSNVYIDAAAALIGLADEEWERVRDALAPARREGTLHGG
jgi:hypothetical protein